MPEFITYENCPCCHSSSIFPALSAKDYTVSEKVFEIWQCDDCTARFTQKAPDAAHIGPYYQSAAYVSHSDTQKGLINRLYHTVRSFTLKSKCRLVETQTGRKGGEILDVGAGTGAFSGMMQKEGWKVTGLEPDETARANAKAINAIELEPAENLFSLTEGQYDAITLWHVLEHVHELHSYLEQFRRLLKKGGKLIIAVPNYTSRDARAYGEYWAAYDVPRHLYHFSPKSMDLLCRAKGFAPVDVKPMWFDSFYVSMLSEQYRTGTGNLVGAVWNGILSNMAALRSPRKCSSVIYIFSNE